MLNLIKTKTDLKNIFAISMESISLIAEKKLLILFMLRSEKLWLKEEDVNKQRETEVQRLKLIEKFHRGRVESSRGERSCEIIKEQKSDWGNVIVHGLIYEVR